ncbi:GIY-YIG nuclease family protein [bacterium]|nr:GIY-YIG nuclease family protein [bacterium]
MSTGWVYVLSNPSIPNKVKVGWTKNRPESRAKELQSTGVPTPFKVETAMLFANKAEQIEHKTHDILSRTRVSSNREWFDCDASIAAGSILKAAEFFHEEVLTTDPVLLTKDDILKANRREEQERAIQVAERAQAQKLREEQEEEIKKRNEVESAKEFLKERAYKQKEELLKQARADYALAQRQHASASRFTKVGTRFPSFEEWQTPEGRAKYARELKENDEKGRRIEKEQRREKLKIKREKESEALSSVIVFVIFVIFVFVTLVILISLLKGD